MKQRWRAALALIPIVLTGLALSGCGQSQPDRTKQVFVGQPWPKVKQAAQATHVNLFMWGGDDGYNNYVDDYAIPALKKCCGVTLKRVPINTTNTAVNKLLAEKQAGKKRGTIDLIWINGEGFATGAQARLWEKSWAKKLPNAKYIDWNSASINHDFGFPVKAREAPWSRAQFVMIYDSAKVGHPPKTLKALLAWAKAHPGRITYPAPPDFTGTAFVEQAFILLTGQRYRQPFEQRIFAHQAPKLWHYLNAIKPYLWRHGKTYPASSQKLNELYQNGEIDMTMSYNPQFAQRQIDKGLFPKTTRSFVFGGGTLNNTSYLAIPFNAPNKAGAAVVANFMQSPAAQIEKQNPKVLGALTVLEPDRLNKQQRRALSLTGGSATLPLSVLESHRIDEANHSWVMPLNQGWLKHVARR